MERKTALEQIVNNLEKQDCLISALGFISRDLYALTSSLHDHCLHCLGSMGSVTPVALGVALARPTARVLALEGDGSLLMNLGTLATLRRYGSGKIRLLLFDNNCYESTGGQPSQPDKFALENICRAVELPTQIAEEPEQVGEFMRFPEMSTPQILVMKVTCAPPAPRITEAPVESAARFAKRLQSFS